MKWLQLAQSALKKVGFSDEEIKTGLENLDSDIEDTVANAKLGAIFTADEAKGNDSIFGDVKKTAKAEALNGVDAHFKDVEGSLSAEQKTAYAALGNNTYEKAKFLAGALKTALTVKPTGDPNFDDLKRNYDDLNAKLATDYVAKTQFDEVSTKYGKARKDLVYGDLISKAIPLIKDEGKVKGNRHFKKNFIDDVEALLAQGIGKEGAKVKGFIDVETGKVMRSDSPEQPLMIGSQVITVEDLAPYVVEYGEYNKGFTAPVAGVVTVTGDGNNKDGNKGQSIASQRMAADIQANSGN